MGLTVINPDRLFPFAGAGGNFPKRQRKNIMKPALIVSLLMGLYSTGRSQDYKHAVCPGRCFIFPKDRTQPTITPRIIGGFEVQPPHLYPYQVALYIGNRAFCGGTLVATDWILTAAHCLDGKPRPSAVTASLGRHNIQNQETESRQDISIARYFVHPRWNEENYQNDLALLKLSRNASLNQYVNIIEVTDGRSSYVNVLGMTLGWGITEYNSMSTVLRAFYSIILSNVECRSIWPFQEVITPGHMCISGRGNVGTCNGDSGGPLVVDNKQIGIVSFGYILCNESKPSVYTRLSEYNTWIIRTMQNSSRSREMCGFLLLFLLCICIFRIILFM